MPIPQRTYGKGKSGVAMVLIVGDKVSIEFEDNGQVLTVLLADAPSYIRKGRQSITMNSSNTEIYSARPLGGTHRAVFAGFTGKEGEPPTIREVAARSGIAKGSGKKYNIKAHLEFTAMFDITAGKWKNYRLVYNLPYGFERYSVTGEDEEDDDTPSITLVAGGKLADFLQLCGMDFETDTIPWSDNVLVFLSKLLLSRKRELAISLDDNGWVKDIGEIPAEDDDEDEDDVAPANLSHPNPTELAKSKAKAKVEELSDELYGKDVNAPVKEEKKAPEKASKVQAPTMLDILLSKAKGGDEDALRMVTALAATNPNVAARLAELIDE